MSRKSGRIDVTVEGEIDIWDYFSRDELAELLATHSKAASLPFLTKPEIGLVLEFIDLHSEAFDEMCRAKIEHGVSIRARLRDSSK